MKNQFAMTEIMNFKLAGLPKTRRGMDKYAKKHAWTYVEVTASGKAGVRKEYQLPDDLFEIVKAKKLGELADKADIGGAVAEFKSAPIKIESPTLLADWQRDCAIARLAVVRHVLKLAELSGKTKAVEGFACASREGRLDTTWTATLKQANAKSGGKGGKATVSRRTLFNWIKDFETAEASDNASAVAQLAPKARETTMPPWAGILLKLWSDPAKPELAEVMRRIEHIMADSGGQIPSYHQARYFLTNHLGSVERERGRMGSREIKNIKPFVRRDTTVLLPSDVYTADGHTFDAEVSHPDTGRPFRPEITTVLDVHTRMVVGYSIDLAESGLAVLDAISSAACDYGIPAIFYVDNGSGYKNAMIKDESYGLMTRLGTEVRHSIAYNSQARGAIERVHKSIWIRLAKKLPTYIGADMDRQAKQAVFKKTRKEVKEFGESKLLLDWNKFLELAAAAVVAYNNEPHSSLPRRYNKIVGRKEHLTPQVMWDEQVAAMTAAGHELMLVSAAERDDLYRPYVTRKCLRGEINLFNNKYFSKELEQYHGEMMMVGYDIHDGSKVWVRDATHRLVAVAEFEANKVAYFAQSALGDAREKRALGQLRRVDAHRDEVLENLQPHKVLEHVDSQRLPEADIEKAKAAWDERLIQEAQTAEVVNYQPTKTVLPEPMTAPQSVQTDAESQDDRFRRWLKLEAQVSAGELLDRADQDFYELYPESKIFDIKMKAYRAQHEADYGTTPFMKWG
ncbi:Mu transposase C-terminal domain-containing protein [Psychrobacter pygoscelis]|uniref:Mu transposase C-terminal domain-containing protein n=1 Tax=Psychrobacter pygoscelis TaxID=2488563 RepID=UPI00103EFBDB|nr:Mu transposase C-terminal domain-containing protein [Psychrobacter pygoscelis]